VSGDNPLHRARVSRGIALADIARRTCLSPQVVQRIDAGRFDQLPAGVYARSYVRSFALAVGLDPESALASVAEHLPPPDDPLPVMRDVAERRSARWLAPIVRQVLPTIQAALASVRPRPKRRDSRVEAEVPARRWTASGLARLRLPVLRASAVASSAAHARRAAAIGVDASVLVALHVLLLQLTSWTTGATPHQVFSVAGAGVTAVWALLVVQYFLLLGGVGGRTPGAWLFGLRPSLSPPRTEPLGLRAILHRTVPY
jgi:hypothetical protein